MTSNATKIALLCADVASINYRYSLTHTSRVAVNVFTSQL